MNFMAIPIIANFGLDSFNCRSGSPRRHLRSRITPLKCTHKVYFEYDFFKRCNAKRRGLNKLINSIVIMRLNFMMFFADGATL
jgi:hypothetical protein